MIKHSGQLLSGMWLVVMNTSNRNVSTRCGSAREDVADGGQFQLDQLLDWIIVTPTLYPPSLPTRFVAPYGVQSP